MKIPYELIFEEASIAYACLERETPATGKGMPFRLVGMNSAFARLTGVSAEIISGMNCDEAAKTWVLAGFDLPALIACVEKEERKSTVLVFSKITGRWLATVSRCLEDGTYLISCDDVSDRMETGRALKESETGFRSFVETMNDLAFIADREGQILFANRPVTNKTGYSPEELASMNVIDIHPAELRQEASRIREELFAHKRVDYPLPFAAKDGTRMHCATRAWIGTRDEKECLFIISRDLSHEQSSLQMFNTIFETNPALMMLSSVPDGKIIEVNQAFLDKTEYTREDCVGKTSQEIGLVIDIPTQERLDDELKSTGKFSNHELQIRTKSGKALDGLLSGELIESQESTYFLTVMIDITEQKKAERRMRETGERLTLAIRAGNVGIWEYHLKDDSLVWDDQMLALYGVTRENFKASYESWKAALHPDDRARGDAEITMALRGEKDFNTEFRIVWPNGETRYIRGLATVITDRHGRADRMIGTNWDITAQKNTEEKLQKEIARANELMKQADTANEAKSNFLSMMSHEIRTPMNGIIGMIALMLDTDLSEEQRKYAMVIRSSGESLLALINDILDFSKIEAGKITLENIAFHLRLILEDSIDILALRAREKGLVLASVIDPDVPVHLRGDPGRLRQILINLIGNAIKFTEKGSVTVRLSLESDDGKRTTVRCSVTDTGIGIPEELKDRLFDRFTQVDSSTSRKFGGTGLGLSIAKKLAHLMGGNIGMDSVFGVGSTFWFTASFERREAGSLNSREDFRNLSGMRVLVVDGDDANRLLVTSLLAGWGCRYSEAPTATLAHGLLHEAFLAGDPFDAALLDSRELMNEKEELLHLIEENTASGKTVFILMTDANSTESTGSLSNLGLSLYLEKPIRESELHRHLSLIAAETEGRLASGKPRSRVKILIAEDNVTNLYVIQTMLEKLGYRSDSAADGKKAAQAVSSVPYDLVFMDCQMPVMDGFEATRLIREAESGVKNAKRIPIVAMTANALRGDREKCLAAGMNDYLSKPIEIRRLASALARWVPDVEEEVLMASEADESFGVDDAQKADTAKADQGKASAVFAKDSFLERIMGDEQFARRIISTFIKDIPSQLDLLSAAIDTGDAEQAGKIAHRIKGSSANVSCAIMRDSAMKMETAGKLGDLMLLRKTLPELRQNFEDAREALLAAFS